METYKLYVVLTRSSSIVSSMIHFLTKDKYTHAALSFDENLGTMYSFARKYRHNPLYGAFIQESVHEGFLSLSETLPGAIIELSVTETQYKKVQEMIYQFEENDDLYRYNYIGLVYSYFGKALPRKHHFFCSEFVYYVLYESGILDFGCERSLVAPLDFWDMCFTDSSHKIIYEGDLKKKQPILYGRVSC